MELIIQDYMVIFIAGILTSVLTVMLRAFVITGVQVLLLLAPLLMQQTGILLLVLSIAQAALSIWTIYKIIRAIDMNYQLIQEKTHEKRPNLIKTEHRGSRFSFWDTH